MPISTRIYPLPKQNKAEIGERRWESTWVYHFFLLLLWNRSKISLQDINFGTWLFQCNAAWWNFQLSQIGFL